MRLDQRERLAARIARSIVWGKLPQPDRNYWMDVARKVAADLIDGSAEGKATERAMRMIIERIA